MALMGAAKRTVAGLVNYLGALQVGGLSRVQAVLADGPGSQARWMVKLALAAYPVAARNWTIAAAIWGAPRRGRWWPI